MPFCVWFCRARKSVLPFPRNSRPRIPRTQTQSCWIPFNVDAISCWLWCYCLFYMLFLFCFYRNSTVPLHLVWRRLIAVLHDEQLMSDRSTTTDAVTAWPDVNALPRSGPRLPPVAVPEGCSHSPAFKILLSKMAAEHLWWWPQSLVEEVVGGGECFQETQGSRASPNCRGPDYSLLGGPTTRGHPGSHVLSLQSVFDQGVV